MAKSSVGKRQNIEFLLEDASFRCDCVRHNTQTHPWIEMPFEALHDKVYVITDGSGWLGLDGARYKLVPGRVLIFPAGVLQDGDADLHTGFKVLWTHFEAFTTNRLRLLTMLNVGHCFVGRTASAIETLMREAFAEWSGNNADRVLALKSILPRIVLHACRAPAKDRIKPDRVSKAGAPARKTAEEQRENILAAARYMRDQLAQPLTLDTVAKHANLSPAYFNHLFRELIGMPPMKFLRRQRIRQAQSFLAVTRKSVAEIAREVGFDDPHHFSKAFRGITGHSPTAYRESVVLDMKGRKEALRA